MSSGTVPSRLHSMKSAPPPGRVAFSLPDAGALPSWAQPHSAEGLGRLPVAPPDCHWCCVPQRADLLWWLGRTGLAAQVTHLRAWLPLPGERRPTPFRGCSGSRRPADEGAGILRPGPAPEWGRPALQLPCGCAQTRTCFWLGGLQFDAHVDLRASCSPDCGAWGLPVSPLPGGPRCPWAPPGVVPCRHLRQCRPPSCLRACVRGPSRSVQGPQWAGA